MTKRKTKKFRGALAGIFLASIAWAGGAGEERVFKDTDGREITAKLLGATASTVRIEMAGGKIFTLPVAKFSAADQAYIRGWIAANPEKLAYEFAFSDSKERVSKERREAGTYEVTEEKWIYKVQVENRSGEAIEGLEARYRIFLSMPKERGSKERKTTTSDGAVALESLEPKGRIEFKTAPIMVSESKVDSNITTGAGETNVHKEELEGIQVKLFLKGTRVGEYRAGSAAVKSASFPDEEALKVKIEEE